MKSICIIQRISSSNLDDYLSWSQKENRQQRVASLFPGNRLLIFPILKKQWLEITQ